jgi:PAS domain S-box-containing protein
VKNDTKRMVLRIILPYVLFAWLWIFLSDRLLEALRLDAATHLLWSIYKGWAFVFVTALLLSFLLLAERNVRAQVQAALRESEERLRALGDNLPGSYVYQFTYEADGRPRFHYISAGVERLHGIKVEDVLQDADLLRRQMDPEQVRELNAAEAVSSRSLTDFTMEMRMRRIDGKWRWIHVCSRPHRTSDGRVFWDGVATDITERKEAEAASQVVEQRLADIIEFLPDATLVIDRDKRVVAWNRACELMTGVNKEAVLGRGDYAYAESFFRERRPILIDLLDLPAPQLEATYKYVQRKGDKIYAESFIPHLNEGRGAHLWGVAAPLFDKTGYRCGAIEVIRDVTEQYLTGQALRESEQKYRELVELANSIILRWDSAGIVTFMNEFGLRFFGYSAEEILDHQLMGLIVPLADSSGRDLSHLMEQIYADPKAFEQNINENILRNGNRVLISWTNKVVLNAQGEVVEILSIGTDITERKRAEDQIRQLNKELQHYTEELEHRVAERTEELVVAKERAEAADRLKSAFLATMSHELRTPLNSIIGFTGIILQGLAGPLTPEQNKQLEMVRGSARHLLTLINDVLDISKIEAGQLEVTCEPFDLRVSLQKVADIVRPLAEKKELALRMDLAPDIGLWVSDPRRVEQILINLLNNAIKFTEHGHITLRAGIAPDSLCISVTDTGIGIKTEDFQKLFQPFRQIDTGLARNHEGTGLGLAICGRLTEILGGRINVESEPGIGTTFTVMLPITGEVA